MTKIKNVHALIAHIMPKHRTYSLLLISITLAAILSLSPVLSQIVLNKTIRNVGVVAASNTIALSGYVNDIQAAVNLVASKGGGSVFIPAGDWVWNTADQTVDIPGGVNVFGASYSGVVGREGKGTAVFETKLILPLANSPDHTTMFRVNGRNGYPSRISSIHFIGRGAGSRTGDTGVAMYWVKDGRVDHCRFEGLGSDGVAWWQQDDYQSVYPWLGNNGVVDHCDFIDIFRWASVNAGTGYGYGVAIDKSEEREDAQYWDFSRYSNDDLAGAYNSEYVFVEDSYFKGTRHAICGFEGAIFTFRYNLIEKHAEAESGWMIDAHPTRIYPDPGSVWGNRWAEVYGNQLLDLLPDNDGNGPWIKGIVIYFGDAVIWNNTMVNAYDYFSPIGLGLFSGDRSSIFYDEGRVHDTYIWDNTLNGDLLDNPANEDWQLDWDCRLNVDFFLQQRPNYTPYPYPHPLTV